MAKPTKLADIAKRIDAHLKRFEADPKINKARKGTEGLHPFYVARAHASGRFVYVTYITYQGNSHINREEAERYLAWLDAGNVGRHWEALR